MNPFKNYSVSNIINLFELSESWLSFLLITVKIWAVEGLNTATETFFNCCGLRVTSYGFHALSSLLVVIVVVVIGVEKASGFWLPAASYKLPVAFFRPISLSSLRLNTATVTFFNCCGLRVACYGFHAPCSQLPACCYSCNGCHCCRCWKSFRLLAASR